jgi:hypothetical protein
MRKNSEVQRKRWTMTCSEEVSRPKKPDHLSDAMGHLGPFDYETKAEALKRGAYIERGKQRYGISKEFAKEFIEHAARRFNKDEYLSSGAPRFKHVVERVKLTQKLAAELAAHLESLDDITRHELQNAGTGTERRKAFHDLMEDADVKALPRVSTDQTGSADTWVERLRKLSTYADVTCSNLMDWRRLQNLSETDKGGNTNLWKETIGIPRWGLVNDALEIFDIFKPNEATGTDNGPFHSFILDLFEYATGLEGAVHGKVDDWIKRLVPAHREDKLLEAKAQKLDAEWDKLSFADPKLETESNLKRIVEIRVELDEIQRARKSLWQIMWPHDRAISSDS